MTDAPGWGEDETQSRPWTSGAWTVVRRGDELADLAHHGRTVLRSIRTVVRDRYWRTVPPTVTDVTDDGDALRVSLRFTGFGADLDGELVVTPTTHSLRVAVSLTARVDFARNRIGLVVLHAATVAGSQFEVGHVDGSVTETRFPTRISPHQPAMDVHTLSWSTRGVACRLRFDGDVFEMEDQRNWTDASFKTYSTPLTASFPVLVRANTVIRQEVVLDCDVVADDPAPAAAGVIRLVPRGDRLPELLLGATTEMGSLPHAESPTVLVELDADRDEWRSALARAATEADALDVRIVTDRPEAVAGVVEALAAMATRIVRIGVFSRIDHITRADTWAALRGAAVGLSSELVGGTRAHYTELNRRHQDLPDDLPAVSFSSTPGMHAIETRQILESVDMQRLTADNAVQIARGRPVHVGPVTLRARFNAVATEAGDPLGSTVPGYAPLDAGANDPRQSAPALAAWLVASAAAFARPGVASIAWFEASGPRGVRGFPVGSAFRDLLALSRAAALDAVGAPTGVYVLAGDTEALVANLGSDGVNVTLALDGDEFDVEVPAQQYRRVALLR